MNGNKECYNESMGLSFLDQTVGEKVINMEGLKDDSLIVLTNTGRLIVVTREHGSTFTWEDASFIRKEIENEE